MKKLIALLLTVVLMIPGVSAFALHSTDKAINGKYVNYIAESIEKTSYGEYEIDKENIYIIEKTKYMAGSEPIEFYVAVPVLGTDDIAYSIFSNGKYYRETLNAASMLHVENYMNTKIDEYIDNNNLKNITEVVSTIFYGRTGINTYRVVADNEIYFIPYYFEAKYNLANDEECSIELGKAYRDTDFVKRLKKEEVSFAEYKEAQKKAEEEKIAAEEAAEEAKYRPVVSLGEDGEENITVNGYNLKDVLSELNESISAMGFGSNIEIGVKTDDKEYITNYYWQNGCEVENVSNFAKGLFAEITTQAMSGKPNYSKNITYCKFNLKHNEGLKSIKHSVNVSVWNNGVKIIINRDNIIELKVKNSKEIVKYIDSYGNNKFDGFKYEKNDENTPSYRGNLEGLTKTDVIKFEFKLTDDIGGSMENEVGFVGETIKGVFEKYKENKYKSTYILTLSGSKGKTAVYDQKQSSLDGTKEIFSNNITLYFLDKLRFENQQLVEYTVGEANKTYKLKMIFKDRDISQVFFGDVKCTDLKYIRLTEDTKLSDEYTEKGKEPVIKEAKECADTLYNMGLFKGTNDGYELEKSLTREESATILTRLLGDEDKINNINYNEVFSDVDKNRWSYTYVMYCYHNNITKGTSESTFSPDVQIDAEQFVTLLMRLLGYNDVEPDTALTNGVKYGLFTEEMAEDIKKADVFTRSLMVQIVYNGLKTTMSDGTTLAQILVDENVITQEQANGLE